MWDVCDPRFAVKEMGMLRTAWAGACIPPSPVVGDEADILRKVKREAYILSAVMGILAK